MTRHYATADVVAFRLCGSSVPSRQQGWAVVGSDVAQRNGCLVVATEKKLRVRKTQ